MGVGASPTYRLQATALASLLIQGKIESAKATVTLVVMYVHGNLDILFGGNDDILFGAISRALPSSTTTTPHAPVCYTLLRACTDRVLVAVWNPML